MMALWGAIALLTILALVFLFWPFLRRQRQASAPEQVEDRQHQNIDIFRERLAELEQERDAGTLDAENFELLKVELERNLLIDADSAPQPLKTARPGMPQLITLLLLALMIPVISLGLYSYLGRANDLNLALNPPPTPTLDQALAQLRQELKKNPNNPEGWYLLATTLVNQGKFDDALTAFRKVSDLLTPEAPQYAGVQGQIAQAMYFKAGGKMTDAVKAQINKALKYDSMEMASLGLLGIDAYEHEKYNSAIEYWSKALKGARGDAAKSLRTGIEQARQKLIAAGKPAPDMPAMTTAKIQLAISLSDKLKSKVKPDETVFIYARPVGGRMPLAALRKKVSDLPLQVTLDDSAALMPGRTLSTVDKVEVGARVSSSGQAISQPGDLVGTLSPVAVNSGDKVLELVIDRVVE